MGEAMLVGGRNGAIEQKIYKWKQYEANRTDTYYWNRWNAIETVTYKWNKYGASSRTMYRWNMYEWVYIAKFSRTSIGPGYAGSATFWSSYSLDKSTGVFTLTGSSITATGVGLWESERVKFEQACGWYHPVSGSTSTIQRMGSSVVRAHTGSGDYWGYDTYDEYISEVGKGSYLGTVESSSSGMYPNPGSSGSRWYQDRSSYTEWINAGNFIESVTAINNPNEYPSNGYKGGFWYIAAGSSSEWSQGSTSYPAVYSNTRSAYPDNGRDGDFYYVYDSCVTEWSQGEYVSDRLSTDRDRFPDNGPYGDYWYIFDGEA